MGNIVKVWRDDNGVWFSIDSRGRPRNPYSPESCAVLDRLLLNLPPPKPEPEKVCGVCGEHMMLVKADIKYGTAFLGRPTVVTRHDKSEGYHCLLCTGKQEG